MRLQKETTRDSCFPMNSAKILKAPFFIEHHRKLSLKLQSVYFVFSPSYKRIYGPNKKVDS